MAVARRDAEAAVINNDNFAKFRLVGVQSVRQRTIHATDAAHW